MTDLLRPAHHDPTHHDADRPVEHHENGSIPMSTTTPTYAVPVPALPYDEGVTTAGRARPVATGRGWTWAGICAGVNGLLTFVVAGGVYAEKEDMIDNVRVVDAVHGAANLVWAYQVLGVATAAALVIFALGLKRRLEQQEPVGSLTPSVASSGLVLTAAMCLVGSGICTELFHSLRHASETDPDTIAANLGIFNTMGWVWAAAGLATASVWSAARRGSVGRGLGRASLAATALIVLTQVTPFQYMALLPAALWLVYAGISFAKAEGRG